MKIGKTSNFYVKYHCRHKGVTGSSALLSVHWPNGRILHFLVDAGAAQGRENVDYYNSFFPFDAEKLSFIILTHGHHDHQGLLPTVVRQGFYNPIYTHYATANLMGISLYDSCQIKDQMTDLKLCSKNEVEKTLDLVVGCTTKKIIKPDKNIRIVFYSNGHLVGAVLTLVIITCPGEDDITLIFSGDYKDSNIFFNVETPPMQARKLPISAFFIESTYGDVDSTDQKFAKCLKENTVKALNEGKTIIYPAFAQGRYQEILYDIKMWKKNGIIPQNIPVYADGGTSQDFTMMYHYTDLGIKKIMKDFIPKNTHFVTRTKERQSYRKQIMENSNPKIIIAPGGMGSYGPIQNYIDYYISRNDALIHFLGYCSPDSRGYKLINTPVGEKISYNGHEHIKLCDVLKTAEKTSHAQRNKLLNLIQYFPTVNSIVINHGEEKVMQKFREYLLDHIDLPKEKIMIASPEMEYRIESSGIVDKYPSNLKTVF